MASFKSGWSQRALLFVFRMAGTGPYPSQPKFGMRTKAHQSQCVVIGFLIDQNQVGLDVAIPVIFPIASQSMVTVSRLQGLVGKQSRQDVAKGSIKCGPVLAFGFAFVITLELSGVIRRPH